MTDTNYIPTGLGPAESLFQTITETVTVGELVTTVIYYEYDGLYRLTDADYSGGITATYRYAYDPVGNMTAYTQTVTHTAGVSTTRVVRTFDDANRLQTAFDYDQGTTSYYYDANGNLVQILPPDSDPAGAEQFAYDQRNLLITSSRYAGSAGYAPLAAFAYDGQGRRLRQIAYTGEINGGSAVTTTYANDVTGLSQVLASDDGATATFYLYGLDLISQDGNASIRILLADGLGSVRTEMRGSAVAAVTTYEPFGALLAQTGPKGTVYGYTGEQHDSATGLLYLRARYYNPTLRLFMSKDPWPGDVRRPQTMNGWSYVENNPLNRVDPTGRQAECPDGVCGPDITAWLMGEMKSHYRYGFQIRNSREWMTLKASLIAPPYNLPLFSVATSTPFREIVREFHFGVPTTGLQTTIPIGWYPVNVVNGRQVVGALGVLEFALYGLAVDYANVNYANPSISACGGPGCDQFLAGDGQSHPAVTLCGHCIDASDIGNMMFGLGGAARGYALLPTWGAAGSYNVMADWWPSENRTIKTLFSSFISPDGRGAIPGHLIGQTLGFLNESLFCLIVNGGRLIGYYNGLTKTGQKKARL